MPDESEELCFVLSPIGSPGSETRRRADGILDEIIKPALPGYRVRRADHQRVPGILTEQILDDILEATLVVADLTGYNPNVMYELAVRHAVRKPAVQMIEEGQQIPFDVMAVRTIFFRSDLLGREQAIRNLRAAAEEAEEEPEAGNPIGRALEVRSILEADVPGALKRLVKMIEEMRDRPRPGSSLERSAREVMDRADSWYISPSPTSAVPESLTPPSETSQPGSFSIGGTLEGATGPTCERCGREIDGLPTALSGSGESLCEDCAPSR